MSQKRKLLILIDWFVPGYKAGGPIRSCVNICAALKENYDIYVLTTDTDHGEMQSYKGIEPNKWITNKDLGLNIYYAKKSTLTTKQLATQIAFVAAEFVYLNHLFSPYFVLFPLWLKYTNKIKGKMIVAPRGALYESALSLKKYKKTPLLYLYKWMGIHKQITFHATNQREQEAIEQHFAGSQIMVADNLPTSNQPVFTTVLKNSGQLNCIFIARIVPIKNILFLLKVLQQVTAQIVLTIVGPVEDETYWEECNKTIALMPANITINYIGAKPNNALAELIKTNHLFILPTTGENFGHAIFESLLNGRPILISDQTPWLSMETKNAGWDLPLNKPENFATTINNMAGYNQDQFDAHAMGAWQYANNFINNAAAKTQYLNMFK